jgi:hypothetical protein
VSVVGVEEKGRRDAALEARPVTLPSRLWYRVKRLAGKVCQNPSGQGRNVVLGWGETQTPRPQRTLPWRAAPVARAARPWK